MALAQVLQGLAIEAIGHRLRAVTGAHASLEDFTIPPGDPGLFGPESMAWRVHAHFSAMMVGGLSSLMVQALHPRALAAVWDHSDFRRNLRGRLGRTAYFVAATTYGGRQQAMRTIERVNAIHAHAVGTDLQGRPYAANEPALIRWVHLVEVTAFLAAFQHLSKKPLSPQECDRYIAEMTQIGHLLGAVDLPQTLQATEQALLDFQGELMFDTRAQEIMRVIQSYPADVVDRPFMVLVLQAAFDVMPDWALRLTGRCRSCAVQQQVTRLALRLGAEPVQWMLDQQGVAATARLRVQTHAQTDI
jgi:uncharacterized protein (DUF2236 family)